MTHCLNCGEPIVHTGVSWTHETHNSVTARCTMPMLPMNAEQWHMLTEIWDGWGTSRAYAMEDYLAFHSAIPCWHDSIM